LSRRLCIPHRLRYVVWLVPKSACSKSAVAGSLQALEDAPWVQQAVQHDDVAPWFHELVRAHFKGNTKPPFNEAARAKAGFTPAWYMPLSSDEPGLKRQD
jgi:Protein of unknown function (DUF455)